MKILFQDFKKDKRKKFQKKLEEMNLVHVVQEKNINNVMVVKYHEVIFKYLFSYFN